MLKDFAYLRAATLDEAVEVLAAGDARVHAGGTDLLGCLRDDVFETGTVVSIGGLTDLRGVRETSDGGLRIGALVRVAEVARDPMVNERYPALAQAAGEVGTPQLRNQGTLGGNVCQKPRCWYYRGPFDCRRKGGERCFSVRGNSEFHAIFGGSGCHIVHPSDTAPALTALGAQAVVAGPRGTRTVAMDDFFVRPSVDPTRETVLEPGEIVTEFVLPAPRSGQRSSYRKVRGRRSWDFALAGMALRLVTSRDGVIEDAGVVFSGVAPVPWRSRAVERALTGERLTEQVIDLAAEVAVESADPMRDNGYKLPLVQGIVRSELEKWASA
jgi:xanthine dehydrogenase YagS FAD-binding subunit